MSDDEIPEAKKDIPGYEPADGEKKCANCGAFEAGRSFCHMFDVPVNPHYVCDDWVTEEKWREQKTNKLKSEISYQAEEIKRKHSKLKPVQNCLYEIGEILEGKKGVHHFLQLQEEDGIRWNQEFVHTACLLGLFLDAKEYLSRLKEALREKRKKRVKLIKSTASEKMVSILQDPRDWGYTSVQLRRCLRKGDLKVQDLLKILRHASAAQELREEKLDNTFSGEYHFLYHSLEGDKVDFVISNMPAEHFKEAYQNAKVAVDKSGICYFKDRPSKKFVLVKYGDGSIDTDLADILSNIASLSGDEEIVKEMDKYHSKKLKEEGYWYAVDSGKNFISSLPRGTFDSVRELSEYSTDFLDKFTSYFPSTIEDAQIKGLFDRGSELGYRDFSISEISEQIAEETNAGDDSNLNQIEKALNATINNIYHTCDEHDELYQCGGAEFAGLSRRELEREDVENFIYSVFIAKRINCALKENADLALDIFRKIENFKDDIALYPQERPYFELHYGKEKPHIRGMSDPKDLVEYTAVGCTINPHPEGHVQFSLDIFSGIDIQTGEFEFTKYIQDGNSMKKVDQNSIDPEVFSRRKYDQ